MRNQRLACAAVILSLLSLATGCRRSAYTARPTQNVGTQIAVPKASPEPEQSVLDLIKQQPFLEKEKIAGMLSAWSRIPNNAHFRLAQVVDFENSSMISDYGELAGAHGLAALIVDKTAIDSKRMSLIIFVERPGNRSDLYWIYRDMDLSKYRMSRSSGDIFVDEVHEDGSKSACEIRWDKKERTWACRGLGRL